jgi:hypothetical protein
MLLTRPCISAITSIVTIPPVTIIAKVSGAEDAVEKPEGHPIRGMLAVCLTSVKKTSSHGADGCLLPGIQNAEAASFVANMMPEEGWSTFWIAPFLIYQVCPVLIHSVVHSNSHLLGKKDQPASTRCARDSDVPSSDDRNSRELDFDDRALRHA